MSQFVGCLSRKKGMEKSQFLGSSSLGLTYMIIIYSACHQVGGGEGEASVVRIMSVSLCRELPALLVLFNYLGPFRQTCSKPDFLGVRGRGI